MSITVILVEDTDTHDVISLPIIETLDMPLFFLYTVNRHGRRPGTGVYLLSLCEDAKWSLVASAYDHTSTWYEETCHIYLVA